MINLKLSKKEMKSERAISPLSSDYPWGTQLSFENPTIKKIKMLQNVKGGAIIEIHAIGKVTQIRTTEDDKSNERQNIEIQIQKIELGNANEAEEAFNEE